ncbi:hypothetical protein O3P69_015731 [Scylla paramamosain]|uniref:Uncharacterized protein n=1 Tax=Scylla paramamosain TaxID=85552 RepID=A0AAW0T7N9_SCYPA
MTAAAAAAGRGLRGHVHARRCRRGSSRACLSKAISVIVWWFERLAAHSSCCSASSLPVLRARGPQYEDPLTLKAEGEDAAARGDDDGDDDEAATAAGRCLERAAAGRRGLRRVAGRPD